MAERFPCAQCGAVMRYAVGSDTLQCEYCEHLQAIPQTPDPISERDYHAALAQQAEQASYETQQTTQCQHCGAEFTLQKHQHADDCPFCGSAVVLAAAQRDRIAPWALLPFSISHDKAMAAFRRWVKGRWLAPSALKSVKYLEQRLVGMYLPHWTYDSATRTRYDGMRGTVYYVNQSYTVTVNGRAQRRVRRVAKVRWRNVSGRVSRAFDDVLIAASRVLPQKLIAKLRRWDLGYLRHYQPEYLAGFQSEYYQVSLDDGFHQARQIMDRTIRADIRRDIGGDRQQILNHQTEFNDVRFKHLLLPVWIASFRYRSRSYRFVINARNGEVIGEYPFSWVKLALIGVAGAALLFGAGWVISENPELFAQLLQSSF